MPRKAYQSDACFDVVATSMKDHGNGILEYGLSFQIDLPFGCQLDLRARSSICRTGLILSNCIGTGDSGYTGEYKAFFYNIAPQLPNYKVGDRILQVQVTQAVQIDFIETDHISNADRNDNGIGSTGNK